MEKFSYDNGIVKKFSYATLLFGVVGMSVGLWIALQLAFPSLNIAKWVNFGRMRPLHTNAIIFAFVGNGFFAAFIHTTIILDLPAFIFPVAVFLLILAPFITMAKGEIIELQSRKRIP